jgi:hypothetical protein
MGNITGLHFAFFHTGAHATRCLAMGAAGILADDSAFCGGAGHTSSRFSIPRFENHLDAPIFFSKKVR